MILLFDTETTGKPKNYKAPSSDTENWPRLVQIAWEKYDYNGVRTVHDDPPFRFMMTHHSGMVTHLNVG